MIALCILFGLTACNPIQATTQPVGGFDTIRFRRTIQVRDHALNVYTFAAGARFIADRAANAQKLYCGQATINDDSHQFEVCIGVVSETKIILGPGAFLKEVVRDVPEGAIEIRKLRL